MTTPSLQLATLFETDARGRLTVTRDATRKPAPQFVLVRSARGAPTAWGIGAAVGDDVAAELVQLADAEPAVATEPPRHAARYRELTAGTTEYFGPAFAFPERLDAPSGAVAIDDERLLDTHFAGWIAGEIAAISGPMLAIVADGVPVSIAYTARRGDTAAECGVDTAAAYRGRGHAARVVSAWAAATRASGRTPLYSTTWTNAASLAVARKLGLVTYASDWTIG